MQTITMMTRFLHAVACKNTKALGSFEIIGTKAQANASKRLYVYLIEAEGSPEHGPLLKHAHRLMDVVVRSKNISETHIACPTDQAACLALLRLDGFFGMANAHTGWFAMLQHNFFDIGSHTVRLKLSGHTDYLPIEEWEEPKQNGTVVEVDDDVEQSKGEFTIEEDDDDDDLDEEEEEDADEEQRRLVEAERELSEVQQDDVDEGDDDTGAFMSFGEKFGNSCLKSCFPPTGLLAGTFMDVVRGIRTEEAAADIKEKSLLG